METYLETETQYYSVFDKVTVLSLGVRKKTINQRREIKAPRTKVYPIIFGTKLFYIVNGIVAFADMNFYKELVSLIKEHRFTLRRFIRLIIYVSRSHSDCRKIIRTLKLKKITRLKMQFCIRTDLNIIHM